MVKRLLKKLLYAVAPAKAEEVFTRRTERHIENVLAAQGIPRVTEAFTAKHGYKILSGPFAGMTYIETAKGSTLLPKLIGSYEVELAPTIEKLLQKPFNVVLDVGCAEGYYAVGFAKFMKGDGTIYAFDINPAAQALCRELAEANQVTEKVKVMGKCDPEMLQQTLQGESLVFSDCEGYENILLDPEAAPALKQTHIVVELHEQFAPNVTRHIWERFGSTHEITLIDTRNRSPKDYPVVSFLPEADQQTALSEFRHGPQQWAYLEPKA